MVNDRFEKYSHVVSHLILDFSVGFQEPEISIMIPTYKRHHLLNRAINSISNQVTGVNYEIVIVDNDGDGEFNTELMEVISGFNNENIKYYRNAENIGMFGNWNRCIQLARGNLICILNDDDYLKPDFIESACNIIYSKQVRCVSFDIDYNDLRLGNEHVSNNDVVEKINANKILTKNHLFFKNYINGSLGVVFEKNIAVELGGFDEELFPISDWDFWFRWVAKGNLILKINQIGATYTIGFNESLKPEVISKFSTMATKCRKTWVLERQVSNLYGLLVKPMGFFDNYSAHNSFDQNFKVKKLDKARVMCMYFFINYILNPIFDIMSRVRK
ncbi:glycosyltransferase family 2 protein [Vibrio lentus]|uniref:glycosyltransferase family 2 protein n=1 Tax=Vibrio lentus TaxID=136468 RepID=UPI00178CA605|nr:glycosyltransferase [Vibrio lentus]MDN3632436.1 glycosyltransferase [Vibrio lentus]